MQGAESYDDSQSASKPTQSNTRAQSTLNHQPNGASAENSLHKGDSGGSANEVPSNHSKDAMLITNYQIQPFSLLQASAGQG